MGIWCWLTLHSINHCICFMAVKKDGLSLDFSTDLLSIIVLWLLKRLWNRPKLKANKDHQPKFLQTINPLSPILPVSQLIYSQLIIPFKILLTIYFHRFQSLQIILPYQLFVHRMKLYPQASIAHKILIGFRWLILTKFIACRKWIYFHLDVQYCKSYEMVSLWWTINLTWILERDQFL